MSHRNPAKVLIKRIQVWNATSSAATMRDRNISINLRFAHHIVL